MPRVRRAAGLDRRKEYIDAGVRAGNAAARHELARLKADAKRRVFDVIVIWEVSRWSRDGWQGMADFSEVMTLGVRLADTRRALIDPNEPLDFMRVSFDLGAAKQESKTLADRARRGQAGQVTRGFNSGGRVYGYKLVNETRTNDRGEERRLGVRLEVYEPEARIVRRIFQSFVDGGTYNGIARQLTREGVPAPRTDAWIASSVSSIVSNPKYIGEAVYGSYRLDGEGAVSMAFKRGTLLSAIDSYWTPGMSEILDLEGDASTQAQIIAAGRDGLIASGRRRYLGCSTGREGKTSG